MVHLINSGSLSCIKKMNLLMILQPSKAQFLDFDDLSDLVVFTVKMSYKKFKCIFIKSWFLNKINKINFSHNWYRLHWHLLSSILNKTIEQSKINCRIKGLYWYKYCLFMRAIECYYWTRLKCFMQKRFSDYYYNLWWII